MMLKIVLLLANRDIKPQKKLMNDDDNANVDVLENNKIGMKMRINKGRHPQKKIRLNGH